MLQIRIAKLHKDAILPWQATTMAAGWDLFTCTDGSMILHPSKTVVVGTGIAIELPPNCFGYITGRSGLAKRGIHVHPGTIDPDYRGEIKLILTNLSERAFLIEHGQRLAQLLVLPRAYVSWKLVPQLTETLRGSNGLGSTGI